MDLCLSSRWQLQNCLSNISTRKGEKIVFQTREIKLNILNKTIHIAYFLEI